MLITHNNMRRKIIKQGNNSYTVTLPIEWIRDENLVEGSEIEINRENSHLNITLPKELKRNLNKINIDLKYYNERTIRNILNQSYRKGHDVITLSYKSQEQLEDIKKIVKSSLFGFEIIEIKDREIIIQNIAEPDIEKFDVILRKIFFIIEEESKEILLELQENKINNLKKREEEKNSIDGYTNLCRRLIIRERIGGTKESYSLILIVSRLSLIYHSYYYMYKALNKKTKLNKETLNMFSETNKLFKLLEEAFYKKDIELCHKIGILKDKLIYNNLYHLLKNSKGEENIVLYHLGEIIRLIHLSSISIFGLIEFSNPM